MRKIYNALTYLLTPAAVLRLYWRSRKASDYKKRIAERFGRFSIPDSKQGGIWVHAVSVGEVLAAAPLIKAMMNEWPNLPMVVTCTTPTGSERIKESLPDSIFHVYAPYDLPTAVNRFLDKVKPKICVLMETELWPNILHCCHEKKIPTVLANARLSAKSAKGYGAKVVRKITQLMMNDVTKIAAQAKDDADRFVALGAKKQKVHVVGNMKFDLELPQSTKEMASMLRRELGVSRPVWIAASTHEGEDDLILKAHRQLCETMKDALLILVPRHPERFDKVFQLSKKHGFKTCRRSTREVCRSEHQVYLGDTMGELRMLLGAADVTLMGGSFVPVGGHNMLEPALYACPVLSGPHVFNFAEVSDLMLKAGGMQLVKNEVALAKVLLEWLNNANLRDEIGQKALRVVKENRGALDRHVALLKTFLT